jgi:hypothetical protein
MAKVTFWCDSSANINSRKEETFDTVEDLGMKEGEWEDLTDEAKEECVYEWTLEHFEFGWKD